MKAILVDIYNKLRQVRAEKVYRTSNRKPVGYERICHFHIRKTAGTSINSSFWEHAGFSLNTVGRKSIVFGNGLVMVRNNTKLIESGEFFYANTHTPFWLLKIPSSTYAFCIFREPFERLMSLYKYYCSVLELDPKTASKDEPYYRSLIIEAQRASRGFDTFLELTPKSDLLNQLYKFSESFDIDEAINNCSQLSAVFFQANYEKAVESLSIVSQLELKNRIERKSTPSREVDISAEQKAKAMELLSDEYTFYKIIKAKYAG